MMTTIRQMAIKAQSVARGPSCATELKRSAKITDSPEAVIVSPLGRVLERIIFANFSKFFPFQSGALSVEET